MVVAVGILIAVTLTGFLGNLLLGSRTKEVAGSSLYFRPVLCTISNGPVPSGPTVPFNSPSSPQLCSAANAAQISSTPPFNDAPTATVILPYYDHTLRYVLGPADMDGSAIATTAVIPAQSGGYQVELTFTSAGTVQFGHVAAERYPFYAADPTKPPYKSLEAIEINGTVVAAEPIQAQQFKGITIIRGTTAAPFTRSEADGLAQQINLARGQLPLSPGSSQSTSATT